MAKRNNSLIPAERSERAIPFIRGHKVMLDADLAALYGRPRNSTERALGAAIAAVPLPRFRVLVGPLV
jgi:hypothetical protein